MANVKISQLPAATLPLVGTELVPIVQGGVTDKTTIAAFTTATAGYIPGGTGAVARSVASKLGESISVKDFGALGDGSDATIAINEALAAVFSTGQSLFFPAGDYWYDGGGVLGSGVIVYGEGAVTRVISRLANPTDGYLFSAGFNAGVTNISFINGVPQTGGSYVVLNGSYSYIDEFTMNGDFNGIRMLGVGSRISDGVFTNGASNAIRIRAEGGDTSQTISGVLMGAQSPQICAAGVRVRNSSALTIINTSVIQQGFGLLVDPTVSTSVVGASDGAVYSLYVSDCFFDNSSGNGIRINPSGTGSVVRSRFANTWSSSSTGDNVYIVNGGSGTLSGIHLSSCHLGLSVAGAGLTTGGTVSDIQIVGGWICQNAVGVYFGASTSKISVVGCTIGSGAGLTGNTTYGVTLPNGTDDIIITGNQMVGNTLGAINDASVSTDKVIFNNIGPSQVLNSTPIGGTTPAAGAFTTLAASSTVSGTGFSTYLASPPAIGGTAPAAGAFTTLSATSSLNISAAGAGQIVFPATQNPSANVNTLDDYEEGNWTPVLTFVTPGDLSVSYAVQLGEYTKIGRLVFVNFSIQTSVFTHTTASGNLTISGLPFTVKSGMDYQGGMSFSGIVKATYTDFTPTALSASGSIVVRGSGSAVGSTGVTAADVPTGGTVVLRGTICYNV